MPWESVSLKEQDKMIPSVLAPKWLKETARYLQVTVEIDTALDWKWARVQSSCTGDPTYCSEMSPSLNGSCTNICIPC